jgi:hypothetical protein
MLHIAFCHFPKIFASQRTLGSITKNCAEVTLQSTNRQLDNSTFMSAIHQTSPKWSIRVYRIAPSNCYAVV